MSDEKNEETFLYSCWFTLCLLIIVPLSCTASSQMQATDGQKGPTTWTVMVGGEMGNWQFMHFYPENITINVHDTIMWKINSSDSHTLFFPKHGEKVPEAYIPEGGGSPRMIINPWIEFAGPTLGSAETNGEDIVSSGHLGKEPIFLKVYNITFTKAGTFEYYCGFHRMMKGTVTVQPAGTPYPKTQAQTDTDAAKLLAADIEAAVKAEHDIKKNVSTHPGPNSTTIYEVKIGYSDGNIAMHQFIPANLTIHTGDSVEWTQNETDYPHTVTFPGGKVIRPALAEPQQKGPPKLIINPDMLAPAGGTTYNGKGYFNSGIMWGTLWPIAGPKNYSLTFDTPGTYRYFSLWTWNMSGLITVLPKS